MAINIIDIKYNKAVRNTIHEFICDTDADFALLPKCDPGSIAVSVATGTVYVVNASGNWVEFGVSDPEPDAPVEPEYPEASEGLALTLKADNTYEVSSIGACADLDIIIPTEANGITVTSIGEYAFYSCASITGLTIPNSVTTICTSAFKNCTGLTSVTLPDNLTTIEGEVFNGCAGLTSITIPDGVISIGSYAFRNCTGLTSIVIPDGVTTLDDNAFSGCTNLESVTIPDSVTIFVGATFYDCTALTSVTFKGTIKQWNAIEFGKNWRANTPFTYIQCSDGQVAL